MSVDTNEYIQLPQLASWGNDAWRQVAACRGTDVNVFFPEKGPLSVINAGKSKVFCMQCSVRFDCLKFAVDNFIKVGTYGGLSPTDRRSITSENISEEHTKFRLTDAYATLRRAKDKTPVATLSRIIGETEEWVKEQLANGGDFLF